MKKPVVFILSVSSDIGLDLAKRYLNNGYSVIGTYRSFGNIHEIARQKDCHLIRCDISQKKDIQELFKKAKKLNLNWDIFISCVGWPKPLTPFLESDFNEWSDSVHINALEPLRVFHGLYPLRNKKKISHVIFFAAGGVNNAVVNFSAYTISKILLIKMCEFIDAESANVDIFIVGPGWTKSKIHQVMLKDKKISRQKFQDIQVFLKGNKGTDLKDIFDCLNWLVQQGKKVASGRNFSVAHDPWKGKFKEAFVRELKSDPQMFKLRRYKNNYLGEK